MNINSSSCVPPQVAKKKLEGVKINISGVDADNALDLLLESLDKNLKNLTLEDFKKK